MIKEHNRVVLTSDLEDLGLRSGDVGTIVHIYPDSVAYEIEFFTLDGNTYAVATVDADDVRLADMREVTHARKLDTDWKDSEQ